MLEKTYQSMNNQITPSPGLIADTLNLINSSSRKTHTNTKQIFRRPVAVTTAIILCLVLATPALAAGVPAVYNLMYLVSPTVAQYFVPVRESCEDNDIRMEVVSAYIHNNTAEIYITMQDLAGNRIDETTDLFDSYSIHRSFDSSATCQRVGYNAETKTATFLLLITEWGNHDITGSKLTFSVREFLSHKIILEDIPVDISLSSVTEAAETQIVDLIGWSGSRLSSSNESKNAVLVPQKSICSPAEGLDITAIGYVDEKLHIQLAATDKLAYDNHGYFYLMDGNGEHRLYDYSASFAEGINSDGRVDYQEFIFDIPQSKLESYTLYGSFYTSGLRTEGNWRVTFPLTAD